MIHAARRAWGATLFVLAVLAPAEAAAEWRRLDTLNFVIIGDVSERDLKKVAVRFEGFRETLGRVLGAQATATAVPTVVIVFPHERAYTPYQPVFNGKPVRVGGVFYGGRDVNYITLLGDGSPEAYRVLFHEYAHLVVSNVVMNLPAWLSEGLAEFYSTYQPSGDGREALIGSPLDGHLTRLAEGKLLSLDELLTVTHASPLYNEGERRSIFYAQSWALTHMLMLGDTPRPQEVGRYLGLVRDGTPERDAWRQAFGDAPIERELEQYVRRFGLRAYSYKFPDALTRVDAKAAAMPQPDVSAFLSSLRVRQDRNDDAVALAEEALKTDPAHPHALVARARVQLANEDYAAAAERLAALSASDDWFVSYAAGTALAEALQRGRDTDSARVAAARRQLEAAARGRELANALARLAALDLVPGHGVTAATRTTIERARALAPGRDDYAFVHAGILAELGDFAGARRILGPLMTPAYPEHVRSNAKVWMSNVGRMEAFTANAAARAEARARANDGPAGTPPPRAAEAVPIFRTPAAGEQRLQGVLERIACPSAPPAAFHVRTSAGTEILHAKTLAEVEFITYRESVGGEVKCGPLAAPLPVYVTWRPGAKPGERIVVAVEFLPS